jgi:hypothetical protein
MSTLIEYATQIQDVETLTLSDSQAKFVLLELLTTTQTVVFIKTISIF